MKLKYEKGLTTGVYLYQIKDTWWYRFWDRYHLGPRRKYIGWVSCLHGATPMTYYTWEDGPNLKDILIMLEGARR